jgi:hypothetical protein
MSTILKDFLHQRAAKYQAEARAAKGEIDEWRAAIEQLFAQIRAWLKDGPAILGRLSDYAKELPD